MNKNAAQQIRRGVRSHCFGGIDSDSFIHHAGYRIDKTRLQLTHRL